MGPAQARVGSQSKDLLETIPAICQVFQPDIWDGDNQGGNNNEEKKHIGMAFHEPDDVPSHSRSSQSEHKVMVDLFSVGVAFPWCLLGIQGGFPSCSCYTVLPYRD